MALGEPKLIRSAHTDFTLAANHLSVTDAAGQGDNVRQARLVTQVTNRDLRAA